MDKIKILVFGLSDRVGGVENFYLSHYEKLDKNKYQIDFVVKYNSMYNQKKIEKNKGIVYTIPKFQKNPIKHYTSLKKIIKNGNYDVIHANTVSAADITHLKLAKKYKVKKVIVHSHNCGIKTKFFLKILHDINRKKLKKLGTHYLACTKDAGLWLFGKNKKVTVINNAFELDKFKFKDDYRKEIRKKLKIKENEFVIGHVGRLCYQKNQEFLINIFKKYNNFNKNSKLILIGEGKDQTNLINQIKKLNLEKNVIIEQTDNPYKYYNAFDIFVFPSRYEGLGIVGVEAQINGLPCLFTDVIPKEIVINDNIKFLSLKNEDEWVVELLNKKLKRVSKINKTIEKYDINNNIKELEKIYDN